MASFDLGASDIDLEDAEVLDAASNYFNFLSTDEIANMSGFSLSSTATATLATGEVVEKTTTEKRVSSEQHSSEERVKRFVQVSESDLDRIRESRVPANTKRATKNWMRVFDTWCVENKKTCDLKTIQATDLASILKHAYVEIRQVNKQPYSKNSLLQFRSAIHRELQELKRTINLYTDSEFIEANQVLDGYLKQLKKDGLVAPTQHKTPISDSDKEKIYKHLGDWKTNADHLTYLVWFVITYHFCLRGSEIQAYLTSDDLDVKTNDKGKRYITLATAFAQKNQQGGIKGKDTVSDGMIVSDWQVEAVLLLTSKLSVKSKRLFQIPRKHYQPEDAEWYTGQVFGKNKIDGMMKKMSETARLSQIYTNHSVRATAITTLAKQNVSATTIMRTSGHRNAQSLDSYLQPSEHDKMKTAHLLDVDAIDEALQCATPEELQALEEPQAPPPSASVTTSSSTVTSENSAKFIFSGNFSGAVHIHVNDVKELR
ncbi:uncharacterized protein KIAA1958-like [Sycon ciliatum]|uniref:uncharacterized protein KIAA1958-like n=1 Tax=Sycon ciliatum TaxID=27933 RepID=UPI0031F5F2B5